MNVIRSFTLKSLKRNKKRTIVTIIGVIISAAMLTAVTVFFSSFVSLIQRDTVASGGNWHASISEVPADGVSALAESADVDLLTLERDLGFAALEGSVNDSKPYLFIKQYSPTGFSQMSIRLLSGRLPENENEVIISETVENSAGVAYEVGDTLTLELGTRETPEGEITENSSLSYIYDEDDETRSLFEKFIPHKLQSYTIVGVMARPPFEQSWSAGCGVLGYLDESKLDPSDKVDVRFTFRTIDTSLYDKGTTLAGLAGIPTHEISDHLGFNNQLLRYYGVVSQDNVLSFMRVFAGIIIAIIIIASVSLIYNSFAISVSERSRQLGLLASVGATKSQKRASVYHEGFFIGLIGIPLGILAGIGGMGITLKAIAPLLDSFFYTSSDVTLDLVVPLWAVGATVLLSALTIFISVYVPARRASRIMPIDAIRMTNEVRLTRRTVKTSRLTRALCGFEATIALKNLKRSRKKYRATIISLVISIVLFLTVSTYTNMIRMVADVTQDGVNFDIAVNYWDASVDQRTRVNEGLRSLDLVTTQTEATLLSGTIAVTDEMLSDYTKSFIGTAEGINEMFPAYITALDDVSFAAYIQAVGVTADAFTDAQQPSAILINHGQDYSPDQSQGIKKVSGNVLNIRPGNSISFTNESFEDDPSKGPSQSIHIAAVTKERPMGTLIQGFYSCTLVTNESAFNALVQNLGVPANSFRYTTYLSTSDDQRLEKQIAVLTEALPDQIVDVYNVKSASRAEQNLLTFLGVFIYGFITLISLICVANIFNTVSTNIALRRREFAMLRSVGMTPGGFNRMVRFESVFYGLKGLLFGLPISMVVAFLLFRTQQGVMDTGFMLPWSSYGFAVLLIIVIVFITMLYSTAKIKKENIIDALKDENV